MRMLGGAGGAIERRGKRAADPHVLLTDWARGRLEREPLSGVSVSVANEIGTPDPN